MDGQFRGREYAAAAGRGAWIGRSDNFLETFPLFAAVVLAAHVTDAHSVLTEWRARLYFWAASPTCPCTSPGCP